MNFLFPIIFFKTHQENILKFVTKIFINAIYDLNYENLFSKGIGQRLARIHSDTFRLSPVVYLKTIV